MAKEKGERYIGGAKGFDLSKLLSMVPKGWAFLRAGYCFHEDGRTGVRIYFANPKHPVRPKERRPRLKCLSLDELKAIGQAEPESVLDPMQALVLRLDLPNQTREHTVLDVLLTDDEVRELFNLGANVEIRGVLGIWEGEAALGVGTCKGLKLRAVVR